MKSGQNVKVGFLFLLFLVLLFWATLMVKGGLKGLFPEGRTLRARFETVEGLKVSDKVYFAGVPVGKVTKVDFHEKFVEVEMLVTEENVRIYRGSEIVSQDVSTLGGKQINISRGDPMRGEIDWSEVQSGRSDPTLSQAVERATSAFSRFVDENRAGAERVVSELGDTATNVQVVTRSIRDGEGSVGKLLKDPALYDNVNQAAAQINHLITGVVEGKGSIGPLFNRPEVYERLEFITGKMVTGQGVLGQLLINESLYNSLEGVVINIERITRTVDEGRGTLGRLVNDPSLYDNLDGIVGRLNRGEGTLGRLLTDDYLYGDLKDVVGNLKGITEHLESVTEKVDTGEGTVGKLVNDQSLFDETKKTVENARDILSAFKKFRTYVGGGAKYHGKQKLVVGRAYIRVEPSPSKFLQVGASWLGLDPEGRIAYEGQFDGDRSDDIYFQPEIQMGFRYFDNLLTVRLGLLEGQFGGGLDLDVPLPVLLDSSLRFSVEGRTAFADTDLDGTEIDEDVQPFVARFEASLFLWGHIRLFAGAHNFFDRIGFTGGVALEWHDEDIRDLIGLIGLSG